MRQNFEQASLNTATTTSRFSKAEVAVKNLVGRLQNPSVRSNSNESIYRYGSFNAISSKASVNANRPSNRKLLIKRSLIDNGLAKPRLPKGFL